MAGNWVPVNTDAFPLDGGLDVVTPPLQVKNGVAISASNFEVDLDTGYARIGGYDRFAGGRTLSEQDIKMAVISTGKTWDDFSGMAVWGTTSKARMLLLGTINGGYALSPGQTQVFVSEVKGEFIVGESLQMQWDLDDTTKLISVPTPISGGTYEERAETRAQVEEILAPQTRAPWQSPGIAVDPKVYGLAVVEDMPVCIMRSTAGGVAIFKSPIINSAEVNPNRQWKNVYTSSIRIGEFSRFELVTSKLADPLGTEKIFGVSGNGKAFIFTPGLSFDNIGANLEFITTGMATDTPSHLAVHVNRLFLSFGSSLQFSASGDPREWSPVVGAGEINTGSNITGLLSLTGESNQSALLVSTEKSLFILYGDHDGNFQLIPYSDNTGARPGTLQWIGGAVFQGNFGLQLMATSQSFGGFAASSITDQIKPLMDERRSMATASMVVRNKNQYRVFFKDGSGLYVTFRRNKNGGLSPAGAFPVQFPHKVTAAWSYISKGNGLIPEGEEVLLVGTEDGEVLRLDIGWSFKGKPIPWHIRLAFNHFKDPRRIKQFKRALLEIQSAGYSAAQVGYDLDYRGPAKAITPDAPINTSETGANRFWSDAQWNQYRWDMTLTEPINIDTPGSGKNFSLRMAGNDRYSQPFVLTGVLIHYVMRRLER